MQVIIGSLLFLVFLLSSYKVLQYQRQRMILKRRLNLVSVVDSTVNTTTSALFIWQQKTGFLLQYWSQIQSRIDSLFDRQSKRWLLITLVSAALVTWFFMPFFSPLMRMMIVVISVIGIAGASYWLMRVRQHREFEAAFTQVLGQMSRAVSAGISVPQAIAQIADYQQGMLGREFSLIRDRLEIGIGLKQALDQASIRLPYVSFHFFRVALILNEENGGQLREVLHSLSRTVHDNAAIKMKIKSLTAEPRMTAAILASLPVILIAVMFFKNPSAFITLTQSASGHLVLGYVVTSMALGLAVIHLLTKVRA
ncbi:MULTISPECIES: type II secretion system F family protein [unclassified Moritella]|uniref:type II secretion system F family protein n=1 Tax=unclassified Moritella TaxID=2637987 RepID=UPI001BAD7ADB|nr:MULTISPECIES: type II secretion system F family protein [unclassified Moritella]QUM84535.1 type II secretion system F family protein [Moritella sp. 28]QUM88794.1 type II secretion system F family protein [Moritella sp. 36]